MTSDLPRPSRIYVASSWRNALQLQAWDADGHRLANKVALDLSNDEQLALAEAAARWSAGHPVRRGEGG